MNHRIIAVLTTLSLLLIPALVWAGDNEQNQEKRTLRRASTVMDFYVKNGTGENAETLGHIEDMVINLHDGKIVYYAMSHGETLGFGGKMFAIAPSALKLSDDGNTFILNGVTNKKLDGMEGFNTNDWPRQATANFGGDGAANNQDKGEKSDTKGIRLGRANSVIGMAVRSPNNQGLGSIYDLAVSIKGDEHKVVYAAINHGGTLGVGGKLYPVPLTKLHTGSPKLNPNERVFIMNITQKQLEGLDGFTSGDVWPAAPNREFWNKVEAPKNNE